MLRNFAAGALDILLPRHCPVSGRPLLPDETGPVAPEVLRAVELAGRDYCSRCGAPQGQGVGCVTECASCREHKQGFGTREIVAAGSYLEPLRSMCKAMKFGGVRRVAQPLAAWLVQLIVDRGIAEPIDAVVPMPLDVLRRFERGYNQAELIARPIATTLGKPLLHALKRARHTERQARLSALERRKNVEEAFEVREPESIQGATLLLVDDVMTTGATLAAAARTLKRAGAKRIYGAVAARASLTDDV